MNDKTKKRLRNTAEEVIEEMSGRLGFGTNRFSFRGDGIDRSGEVSNLWILYFWYKGDQGLNVSVEVTDTSTDESIKQDIIAGLKQEFERIGLSDRLTEEK